MEQFKSSSYEQLATQLDGKIASEPANPLYRLWWVQLNLKQGGLPAIALSSPLEEIFETLKGRPELFKQSYSVFLAVGGKLVGKKQYRLAVVLLERAEEFLAKAELADSNEAAELRVFLREVISEEIKAAEKRREPKAYISSLEEKLASLPKDKPKSEISKKILAEQSVTELSAKSIIEKSHEEQEPDLEVPDTDEPNLDETATEDLPELDEERESSAGLIAFGLISMGLILTAYFARNLLWPLDYQGDYEPEQQASQQTQQQKASSVTNDVVSEIELEDTVSAEDTADSELDAVSERLEQLETKRNEEIALKEKQPIEPELEKEPEEAPFKEADLPVAKTVSKDIEAEHLPATGGAEVVKGDVFKGRDGRDYGPPPGAVAKDRSGRKVKGLPVRQFSKPCLLYTSPSPRDATLSRMPSSA